MITIGALSLLLLAVGFGIVLGGAVAPLVIHVFVLPWLGLHVCPGHEHEEPKKGGRHAA